MPPPMTNTGAPPEDVAMASGQSSAEGDTSQQMDTSQGAAPVDQGAVAATDPNVTAQAGQDSAAQPQSGFDPNTIASNGGDPTFRAFLTQVRTNDPQGKPRVTDDAILHQYLLGRAAPDVKNFIYYAKKQGLNSTQIMNFVAYGDANGDKKDPTQKQGDGQLFSNISPSDVVSGAPNFHQQHPILGAIGDIAKGAYNLWDKGVNAAADLVTTPFILTFLNSASDSAQALDKNPELKNNIANAVEEAAKATGGPLSGLIPHDMIHNAAMGLLNTLGNNKDWLKKTDDEKNAYFLKALPTYVATLATGGLGLMAAPETIAGTSAATGGGWAAGAAARNTAQDMKEGKPLSIGSEVIGPLQEGAVAGALTYGGGKLAQGAGKVIDMAKGMNAGSAADVAGNEAYAADMAKYGEDHASYTKAMDAYNNPPMLSENDATFAPQTKLLADYYGKTPDDILRTIQKSGATDNTEIEAALSKAFGKDHAGFTDFVDQQLGDKATIADRNAVEGAALDAQKARQVGMTKLAMEAPSHDANVQAAKNGLAITDEKGNITGVKPSERQLEIAQSLDRVPGIDAENVPQSMAATNKQIGTLGKAVRSELSDKNFAFNDKEFKGIFSTAKQDALDSATITSDAEENTWDKVAQAYQNKFAANVDKNGGDRLLAAYDTRVQMDRLAPAKTFGGDAPTIAKATAFKSYRNALNQFIEDSMQTQGSSYAPQMREMSNLYRGLDSMETHIASKFTPPPAPIEPIKPEMPGKEMKLPYKVRPTFGQYVKGSTSKLVKSAAKLALPIALGEGAVRAGETVFHALTPPSE